MRPQALRFLFQRPFETIATQEEQSSHLFVETITLFEKSKWECKAPRIARIILKYNKIAVITLAGFRTYKSNNNQDTVVLA